MTPVSRREEKERIIVDAQDILPSAAAGVIDTGMGEAFTPVLNL